MIEGTVLGIEDLEQSIYAYGVSYDLLKDYTNQIKKLETLYVDNPKLIDEIAVEKLESQFASIASASNVTAANQSIQEVLAMFSNPETPILIVIHEEGGVKVDFTDEELLFAAFHHDLGKLGIHDKPYYISNSSDWHIKNQGKMFIANPELSHMTHTDRTMFTLQHYGISVTEKEYFGMKLTDGLYDEDNTKYLKVYDAKKAIKSNLPHLMHWADHMSTVIESQDNNI